ncbi:MAG: GTP 3',8-cyclase MoaA [Methanocellales archaeon]
MQSLIDPYGRRITGLRISVTSKCNMSCIYCHSEGEKRDGGGGKDLDKEDIVRIVKVAAEYGVNKVKFSGGEPLLRSDLEEIISALPKLKDISLTTNGSLLADRAQGLKEAGLHRVNISLDTLNEEKYNLITNCRKGSFHRVIEGINAALEAELAPVKLNMVILKGINEAEIEDMIQFIKGKALVLQIIQLLNFKDIAKYQVNMLEIEEKLQRRASAIKINELHRRFKYCLDGAEVEVVRPVNNATFCAYCNRLRVTSDGKLKPCLLRNDNLVEFKGKSELEIRELLKLAVSLREPYNKAEAPIGECK